MFVIECFPNSESLDCVNYCNMIYPQAIEGMKGIHKAGVVHEDIYARNMMLIRGEPDRLVWIDFDIAMTFDEAGPEELALHNHKSILWRRLGICW